jgi:filamentous hemagglutinin family protein
MKCRWIHAAICVATFLFSSQTVQAGSVTADGSLGSVVSPGGNKTFLVNGGTVKGNNLFHSLATLNLDSGETAQFSGTSNIQNVLTRVTGGPSNIDGTIKCDIAGANFYLINPAGVVFGPDASLNVGGSFAVTTADVMHLSDGGKFRANPAANSVLTTAAPAAFGFLASRGQISVVDSNLSVSRSRAIDLVGAGVTVNGGTISAPSGQVETVAAGVNSLVNISPSGLSVPAGSPTAGDVIIQQNATINVDGDGGGQVNVIGDTIMLANSSVSARTLGGGSDAGITLAGQTLCTIHDATLDAGTTAGGNAGSINIMSPNLTLDGASLLADSAAPTAPQGAPGNVTIMATQLTVSADTLLSATTTNGSSNPGTLTVNAAATTLAGLPAQFSTSGTGMGFFEATFGPTEIIPANSNGPTVTVSGNQYTLTPTAGELEPGGNAFIPLQKLNVGTGDQIIFAPNTGVQNIFVTVVGGTPSAINGSIVFNAPLPQTVNQIRDYAVINSAGFIFGGGANLNSNRDPTVSLIVSTATALRFAGGALDTRSPNPTLFAGYPTAFTFSATPAAISIGSRAAGAAATFTGGFDSATSTRSGIYLIGGETVVANATLSAGSNGDLILASLAGPGAVAITPGSGAPRTGILAATQVDVSQAPALGELRIAGGSQLSANNTFIPGSVGAPSGPTPIEGNVVLVASTTIISNSTVSATSGGAVSIQTGDLQLSRSRIDCGQVLDLGSLPGLCNIVANGAATLEGSTIVVDCGVEVNSGAQSGNIVISSSSFDMSNKSELNATNGAVGGSGNITIQVARGGPAIFSNATVNVGLTSNDAFGPGNISVTAGSASINNSTFNAASNGAPAGGGNILVATSGPLSLNASNLAVGIRAEESFNASSPAGKIALEGSSIDISTGTTLSSNTASSGASGSIELTATQGSVNITGQNTIISASTSASPSLGGQFLGGGSSLMPLPGGNGGDIALTAPGTVFVGHGAQVNAGTTGDGNAGDITINAAITVVDGTLQNPTGLSTATAGNRQDPSLQFSDFPSFVPGSARGGDIKINGSLEMTGMGASIAATTAGSGFQVGTNGIGAAGNIQVAGPAVTFNQGTTISSSSSGAGTGGDITINTFSITLSSATLSAKTTGTGTGGSIFIQPLTSGGPLQFLASGASINASTTGAGNAGNIQITGDDVSLTASTLIKADTESAGAGGNVTFNLTGPLTLDGHSIVTADASINSTGAGGDLQISASALTLSHVSSFLVDSVGSGDAGRIQLNARNISLQSGALIEASTTSSGKGGNIIIGNLTPAVTLSLNDSAMIAAQTSGSGKGGNVSIFANDIKLDGGVSGSLASIETDTDGPGAGGTVHIQTNTLEILSGALISAHTFSSAPGGNITINAPGGITINGIENNPNASTTGIVVDTTNDSVGTAHAGKITINSGSLVLTSTGIISASSLDAADGGTIDITASAITLDGTNAAGANTGILAIAFPDDATQSPRAGDITIHAASLLIKNTAQISADTGAAGPGGNIAITANSILIDGRGEPFNTFTGISAGTFATGSGGSIQLTAPGELTMHNGVVEALTAGTGDAKNITVMAGPVTLSDGSVITAENQGGTGNAGTVIVSSSGAIALSGKSSISVTAPPSTGGDVQVTAAGPLSLSDGSSISASALIAGNMILSADSFGMNSSSLTTDSQGQGGSININTGNGGFAMDHSTISAQAANDGNITIHTAPDAAVLIFNSTITAQAAGIGGQIIIDPALVVLDNSTINGLAGTQDVKVIIDAGVLIISSDSQILTDRKEFTVDTNVASGLLYLPAPSFSGLIQLAPTCAQMTTGDISSFVITGHGGLPMEPGGWLPLAQPAGDMKPLK